jgi:hypothetical protein
MSFEFDQQLFYNALTSLHTVNDALVRQPETRAPEIH